MNDSKSILDLLINLVQRSHFTALALIICFCARAIVCLLRTADNAIAATSFCLLSEAILTYSGVMGAAAVWD